MSARNITVRGRPSLVVRGIESAIDATNQRAGAGPAARAVVVLVDALAVTPSTRHRRDVAEVRTSGAAVLVICGAGPADLADLGAWLLAGADAVLPFTCEEADLAEAADALATRRAVPAASRRAELLDAARRRVERPPLAAARLDRLSPRERRVLDGLVAGHTAGRMADDDVVSVSTIRSQLHAVLRKLDVTSPVAAVAVFHEATRRPGEVVASSGVTQARDADVPDSDVVEPLGDVGGDVDGGVAHPTHHDGGPRPPSDH